MTIEEMKARKRELGLSNEMVAERSGVPLGTVQKIFGGATKAPRKTTLDALAKVLMPDPGKPLVTYMKGPDQLYVKESPAVYGLPFEQGGYTLEDYYALPDDERVELIDGVFYDMASATKLHQGVLQGIFVQLDSCVQEHSDHCFIYLAPSDVELREDGKTVVQPDIYIHCDPDKESRKPHHGTPDFVVEIVSPSNRKHDLVRKLNLYEETGVREYWIVIPEEKKIVVYNFEKENIISMYTFEDEVPVGISEGKCSVDFRKVFRRVRHLYDD